MTTTTALDPLISEFASQEEADSYDAWFRAKVQEALDDPRPAIAAEDVEAHFAKRRAMALRKLSEGGEA